MLSPSNTDRSPRWARADRLAGAEPVVSVVRGTAFWTTVLLPVIVPLLIVVGMVALTPITITSFLAAYAACAVLGHNHSPE